MNIKDEIISAFPHSVRTNLIVKEEDFPFPAAIGPTTIGKYLLLINLKMCEEMLAKYPHITAQDIGSHELLHAVFGHLFLKHPDDINDLINRRTSLDDAEKQKLSKYNERRLKSSDCQVNSYIRSLQQEPSVYPELYNLPNKETFEYYFEHIPDDKENEGDGKMAPCSCHGMNAEEVKAALEEVAKDLGMSLDKSQMIDRAVTPIRKKLPSVGSRIVKYLGRHFENKFQRAVTNRPHKWKPSGFFGKSRAEGPKILYAIDVSGSISQESVRQFFGYVNYLAKDYAGTILEFNDNIRSVGRKPTYKDSCGGTDFQKVQEYADKHNFDLTVWFTDGQGCFSKNRSSENLVCLSDSSQRGECEKVGEVILV